MTDQGLGGARRLARHRGLPFPGIAAVAVVAMLAGMLGGAPASATARGAVSAGRPGQVRVVRYHGYEIRVPAAWPVYRLAADPSRCVLFDRHAVYLGTPGASQRCPARAVGRTEAVLVQPGVARSALLPGAVLLPAGTAALAAGAGVLPTAAVAAEATSHVLQVAAPGPGVVVTATFGKDPALVRGILAGARISSAAAVHPAAQGVASAAAARVRPAAAPAASSPSPGLVRQRGSGLGFDTCTAPSVQAMTAWLASPYRVVGTYLGGVNWACDYGNFNVSWVRQVAGEGWRFIPIWVGPQAPCTGLAGVSTIDPAQAAAEGQAEAASAAAMARAFGYGRGIPVYFDMEGYDQADSSCAQAVLTFLGGWTQGLHAAGYQSGVYSSASSGISDLASQYGNPAYPSPDDIWIADWDGDPVLTDPAVPSSDWAGHQRLHQYYGAHEESWGGTAIDVDDDIADGAVAGLPGTSPRQRPALASEPDAITAAPGTAATVRLLIRGATHTEAIVHWQVDAPAGLTVTPSQGVTAIPPGSAKPVTVSVTVSPSQPSGRYDVPVTATTAGGQPLTETFELVSVTRQQEPLPTAYPVLLYAADPASMATAAAQARRLALPAGDVTGSFATAWAGLDDGTDLVLAVGQAAVNALYFNACGWPNPDGDSAGSTPFYYLGAPLQQPPGADIFEPANGSGPAVTAELASQLTHYALAGTLPNESTTPIGPAQPTGTCLGAPDVPVP